VTRAANIRAVMASLQECTVPRAALGGVLDTLDSLCKDFAAAAALRPLLLRDVREFAGPTQRIPEFLPFLDPALSAGLSQALPLFVWLRNSFATDADFSSNLELALGKSETDCPPELWRVDGQYGVGSVDGQALSKLVNLRTVFHAIIYDSAAFPQLSLLGWAPLSAFFSKACPLAAQLAENLRACVDLQSPLMRLLGAKVKIK
jgi:hypothetical protein